MDERDYEKEGAEHQRRQDSADNKIKDHEERMKGSDGGPQKKADEQQLLNEMRGNKAAVDFNRALFDYDEEHRDEKHKRS